MTGNACVYLHLKADTREPFYVGIGTASARPWDMHNGRSKWHKSTVQKHGVDVFVLIKNISKEAAKWWERRHIKALREAGYRLVNMTNGGDGMHGFLHTEETRLKMSQTALSKGNAHQSKTESARQNNSAAQKALADKHPSRTAEMRALKKLEWEVKFGGSPMKVPEIAAKASATALAKGNAHQCKRPEVRNKIGQKSRAAWSRPEYRAKAVIRLWWLSACQQRHYWGA